MSKALTMEFATLDCCACKAVFALPVLVLARYRENHDYFYCPICRVAQHFAKGTFTKDYYKADAERERMRREIVERELHRANESLRGQKAARTRLRNKLEALRESLDPSRVESARES